MEKVQGHVFTAQDSPALGLRSELYPEHFGGRVPLRVRMLETVTSEFPAIFPRMRAFSGSELDCYVNSHGAVSVLLNEGRDRLGVKPDEFEVIAWHDDREGR